VEWDGWPNVRDYTWEPYEHLDESARAYELVKMFHQENPEKPRDPNSARTTRKKEEIKDFRFFLLNKEVFYVKVESVWRKRLR
jgi:hypothetical protein